jgi:diguanylate cyclase (GGDEF)-like protein
MVPTGAGSLSTEPWCGRVHQSGGAILVNGEDSSEAGKGGAPSAAAGRDPAAEQRDRDADRRDQHAAERDQHAAQRDQDAERRDQDAERRDLEAEESEAGVGAETPTDTLNRSALARRAAASDRRRAGQDRRADASGRRHAELDRSTAQADREASARERESSSLDDLTGVYRRGPGLVELAREMARARRAEQPLVVAFVDVDRLKATNDSRGHAAGDRMLLEVADTVRAKLRSHDLIIRYGGDEFVCACSGLNMVDAASRLALVNAALAEVAGRGSVTVGLAELQPNDSPEDLIARADAALYRERQSPS